MLRWLAMWIVRLKYKHKPERKHSTCLYCRKWLRYPQPKDCNFGICIEGMNGMRHKWRGLLSKCIGECPNYAPLTFHWLGCAAFEEKTKEIQHANTQEM